MTEAAIRALMAELRAQHSSLQRPLTWTTLRQLLASDEHIVVTRHRIGPKARIRAMGDVAVISFRVKLPPREWLFAGAHEWAHWLLHGSHEAPTRGYVTRRHRSDDPVEIEADFLARCLIAGPDVHVPWPEAERPSVRRVRELPAPAFDPYGARVYTAPPPRQPAYGGRFGETPLARALRRAKRERSQPPGLVERVGVAVRYVDVDGIRWDVHDVALFAEGGARRRREVLVGNETARFRYFVNALGGRRMYQFGRWDRRDVVPKQLERQLRDGMMLPARKTRRQLDRNAS